jgi:RimJ/RimL family protein N-acetyltransferase
MSPELIASRIAERPEMCQDWEAAMPIGLAWGMFYLSSIIRGEESVGTIHVYIWDKRGMGRPALSSKAAYDLMVRHSLDRLIGEVDCENHVALGFAARIGFNLIGIVRQRKDAHGKPHDVALFDALPGDLTWV